MKALMAVLSYALSAAIVCAACGGNPGPSSPDDAANNDASGDAPACDQSCLVQGWWINVALSNCAVLCMGVPTASECGHSDCEQVTAQRYDETGTLRVLSPLLHSNEARSFNLLGNLMTSSYTLLPECKLQVNSSQPQVFHCTAQELAFSVGSFTAASVEEEHALDNAAASGQAGEYAY
ncbi:MAG TPA: hypothetical protein VGM90_01730 [Kofleriaceae bacterium]|jgi:hypothetical protein